MHHSIWARQSQAGQTLEAIWVTPCSTMAAAKGMSSNRIPISSIPPAMPKMPDRKEVEMTAADSAAANGRVSMGASGQKGGLFIERLTAPSQTRLTEPLG